MKMKEPVKIDLNLVKTHGLTNEEYEKIRQILGREPNFTELGIFSAMWSEYCSYKSSKPVLKLFPTENEYVLDRSCACLPIDIFLSSWFITLNFFKKIV